VSDNAAYGAGHAGARPVCSAVDRPVRLPPLDVSDLRRSRVSGTRRLVLATAGERLSSTTIEAVIAAAADPRCDFRAHNTADYQTVVDAADAVNGSAWTFDVLTDPGVRRTWFAEMMRRAHDLARLEFRRLDEDDRVGAIDRLAFDLSTVLRPVDDIGIRLSSWDAWYVWRRLLPLRLVSAVGKQDRGLRWGPATYVSLDEALAGGGLAPSGIAGLGSHDPDPVELGLEELVWHGARHLIDERIPGMLANCRAGDQLKRTATVCQAALWVLEQGADHAVQRTMFVEDTVSAKQLCWHAMVAVRPEAWGRYPGRAVPTREVLASTAAAIDPGSCECAAGSSCRPRRCWFHSVSSRLKDLNGRDRVLHLILQLVTEMLRESALSSGVRPGRRVGHVPPRTSARPRQLPPPAAEPRRPAVRPGLLTRQVRLGYPSALGYDITALLKPAADGQSYLTVELVRSDERGYAQAVIAHQAATESGSPEPLVSPRRLPAQPSPS
jgi:hypothetical protein